MANEKLVKRSGLPIGKQHFTEPELRAAIDHTKKMVRDGYTGGLWSIINISAAMYNLSESLYSLMGYDSFEKAAESEFGLQRRQAFNYKQIGESLGTALGGGFIAQEVLKEKMRTHLYETRLGYRKMQLLAKSADGMQRLLDSKSEGDVTELIDDLNRGALEIEEEQQSKGSTPLKAAMRKQFGRSGAEVQDVVILIGACIRQVDELTDKYVSKLSSAVKSLPPDVMATRRKPAHKAQDLWNRLRRLQEALAPIAELYPDAVLQAQAMSEQALVYLDPAAVAAGEPARKRKRRIPDLGKIPLASFETVSPQANDETFEQFAERTGLSGPKITRG